MKKKILKASILYQNLDANRQRLIRRNYYWYITQKAERIKKRQKLMSVDRLAPLDAICVVIFCC